VITLGFKLPPQTIKPSNHQTFQTIKPSQTIKLLSNHQTLLPSFREIQYAVAVVEHENQGYCKKQKHDQV
jgi:hypothetical protein